ncbi:MAG TPA: PIN domain-containing protein [Gemmataceae bacterium]|jgi:predicted nucleic acid-binding protein|nr:PIN domain-containing protein [Gemmataceae bacterium]
MARSVIADAGFLVALLARRDSHHAWATAQARRYIPPWHSCEAALSEAFHLLGPRGLSALTQLLRRRAVLIGFAVDQHLESVLALMQKYANVPMSLADACLVRMTETRADPVLLTTDTDFRNYRRHGRQVVPCIMP